MRKEDSFDQTDRGGIRVKAAWICLGLLLLFVGLILCISSFWPNYRTLELGDGQFEERWMGDREFWTGLVAGTASLGGGLLCLIGKRWRRVS